jgi:hypothetical protein
MYRRSSRGVDTAQRSVNTQRYGRQARKVLHATADRTRGSFLRPQAEDQETLICFCKSSLMYMPSSFNSVTPTTTKTQLHPRSYCLPYTSPLPLSSTREIDSFIMHPDSTAVGAEKHDSISSWRSSRSLMTDDGNRPQPYMSGSENSYAGIVSSFQEVSSGLALGIVLKVERRRGREGRGRRA